MKKLQDISAARLSVGFVAGLAITDVLVYAVHIAGWWAMAVLAFVCITFLPGLALLRMLCITLKSLPAHLVYSFGLGIFVLIISGLATNLLLFGITGGRPLTFWPIVAVWNVITLCLIGAGFWTNRTPVRVSWPSKPPRATLCLLVASALLPGLAAFGAFRLNNGGDGLFAMITLGYAACLIASVFVFRRRLPDGALAWLVFVLGLTILLMTSLRGWDIVGHDIQREFRVFTLTDMHSHWDIALDHDPYNACLSITILPEVFKQMLGISGVAVFKLVLQIVFAVCPAILYLLVRQYAPKAGALLGSLLFICYPTFINDSAMLTRQGVAYLFFALALLILSNRAQRKRYKLLFSICALGAILSHYSTAYMFVALFAVAVGCKYSILLYGRWRTKTRTHHKRTVMSPLFACLLFAMTFLWYTQITGTSSGLTETLKKSISSIPRLFSDDNKSSDTSAALFFAGTKTQVDLYQSYVTASNNKLSAQQVAALTPTLTTDDLPLTWLGKKAVSVGLSPSFIATWRQQFAKILQLLAVAGVLYATWRLLRKKAGALDIDFICLNLASLVLLALMVILPVLSINYGLLRAFQQSLIFLILPVTLLLVRLGRFIRPRLNVAIAASATIGLFLLFTGFLAQILGGTSPILSLDNQGLYYGLYYTPATDAAAFDWLKQHVPAHADVRAANFNRANLRDPTFPFEHGGILPFQLSTKSIVYLDQAQVVAQKFYAYFQSSPLIIDFPLNYFELTRNQIYSTTTTRIYQ